MPQLRRPPLAGALAVGVVALIAGCGGGGDDSDALSAEEYRQQADRICLTSNRGTDALTEPESADRALAFLQAGLPIQQEELEGLRALEPPEELRADHDRVVGLLQERQDLIQGVADEIEGGADPEQTVQEATPRIDELQEEGREVSERMGLEICGTQRTEEPGATTAETAPAPTDTATAPATTTDDTPVGQAARFASDALAAAGALQSIGGELQATTSVEDLNDRLPALESGLDDFDAAISKLDGYTLDDPDLEGRREGLARTGPAVSDVLRRFIAAASRNDAAEVQRLLPEVQSAINDFQQAAQGTP